MWLLQASVRLAIEQAQRNGAVPSAEQQARFEARFDDFEDTQSQSRLLTVVDDKAEISVKGVLTKAPSFFAMMFGGGNVTYPEIISALAQADKNDKVKSATLAIDSPGGHVSGLFDALAAIESFSKPLKAVVSGTAASAAFAIAAKADSIVATNRSVGFGSIGIAVSAFVDENEVDIASTAAPKKRPDLTTEAGKAIVREELDAMHEIFAEAIAAGRNTTVENVNARFGQGATLLADAALKRGMIDTIAGSPAKPTKTTTTTTASGGTKPETDMDLQKLKAQHPDVHAAAMQEGVAAERERVSAHLIMGEASGDMKTAITAAKEGTEMTASLNATYQAAGMNRTDKQNRQDDDSSASGASDNADDSDDTSASNTVADLVAANLGYEKE
jgi:ClpP class serine protease